MTDSEKFRVAITTNTLGAGGAEKQRVLLANELQKLGHSVVLYCLQGYGDLQGLVNPGVTIFRRRYLSGAIEGHDVIISGTTNTETAFAIATRLKRGGHKFKWILAIHNPLGPEAPKLKSLSRAALHLADRVLALTEAHADSIRRLWNIEVDSWVPNGMPSDWGPAVRESRRKTKSFEFDVGYIGRISTQHKGLDLLLKALATDPAQSLTLALAGTGPDMADLQDLAISLGVQDRISWLGHQEPADFFKKIGFLALFSRYEGQPMVLLEAEIAGTPVLASVDASAIRDDRVNVVDARQTKVAAAALAEMGASLSKFNGSSRPSNTIANMADRYVEEIKLAPAGSRLHLMAWKRRKAKNMVAVI